MYLQYMFCVVYSSIPIISMINLLFYHDNEAIAYLDNLFFLKNRTALSYIVINRLSSVVLATI